MAGLPNITINLQNGRLGRVAATDDGIAGIILTGNAVEGGLELNTAYLLSSPRNLTTLKITEENNPLVYKDVSQFYEKAGDGAELYLLVVSAVTTLTQMCSNTDGSPVHKLISFAKGRIRLLGFNRLPLEEYEAVVDTTGIDEDAVQAGQTLHAVGESYAARINPFRALLPALLWDGSVANLYKPRESTFNRVGYVMAADAIIDGVATAAIGQALGVLASISVHQNLGRVKNGLANLSGWLTNGKTPEENDAMLDALHDAGYIIYRYYVNRNGYYFNDDPTAAPVSDDYGNISNGRVIDKAIILTYNAYIDELLDNVEVDGDGYIPEPFCRYYEGLIENAIASQMSGEISSYDAYVDPSQNVHSTSLVEVAIEITLKGTLRNIKALLGFKNPALNQ